MSIFQILNRAELKFLFLGALLTSATPSVASDVQIFPPQTAAGIICPPNPPGFTYSLVWDGVSNVKCAEVPLNCALGQGLQYNASTAAFVCVTPCSGPTTVQANVQSCPSGQIGNIFNSVVTQCDGSVTTIPTNTCGYAMTATVSTQCSPGSTMSGYIDSTGNFNMFCGGAGEPVCQTFSCGPTGPVLAK